MCGHDIVELHDTYIDDTIKSEFDSFHTCAGVLGAGTDSSFWTLFSLVTLEKALGMSAILTKYGCIRRTTWALPHMVSVSNCVNVNNDRR
jgi:hypothetical protein